MGIRRSNNLNVVLLTVAFCTLFISSGALKVGIGSSHIKSNSLVNSKSNSNSNGGIYFSDIPLNDAEGSAFGTDDDLDDNASGKGDDDEDAKHNLDEGSGDAPTGSDPNSLDSGSGDEPLFISSTERPTKKPTDFTKKPVIKVKEPKSKGTTSERPSIGWPIDENSVPEDKVPPVLTPETSTKFLVPSSTIRPRIYDLDNDDQNKMNNEVSIMGQKQVTPASFFARPGILAAVIGGAVVGLLCAILLVMFIVYRMRKKDEGSYSLDEPKRSTSANPYARGASKEFYA